MFQPDVTGAMCAGVLLMGSWSILEAKPIAFANGTTFMVEYGANTMREAQLFYAPRFNFSWGGGVVRLASEVDDRQREIAYARVNFLPKRWNLESAQANVFVWGGLGSATLSERAGSVFAQNVGAQFDYETRRVYVSAKTDLQRSSEFSHRIDTLQFGIAPYEHDYDTLATWLLIQGRRYSGNLYDGTESALVLRLFKGNKWVEAGVTNDGKLQAMFMLNF
jgi:hypothetical protein